MDAQNFDFIIIGSGPAGQRAAIQAAKFGKRVCLIERQKNIGGVTVHSGTIPSKTLREAILYLTGWRQRGFYGRDYRLKNHVTAGDLLQRLSVTIRHEIEVINDQLNRNGVTIVYGTASFEDTKTIRVEDDTGKLSKYRSKKILIATGTRPRRPADIPFDDQTVFDSDGLLHLRQIPKSITVVGAGVIGVEYASMFKALDMEVTLVNERPTILGFIDQEIMSEFLHILRDNGMDLRTGEKITGVDRKTGSVVTTLEGGRKIESKALLFTAGRKGCTSSLKLENAGITANDRHYLQVDKYFRTSVPHIYAAGDVIGFPSLASTSMEQGRWVACHAFGQPLEQTNHLFPYGIYSVPEISMIGKTEQELIENHIPYETGISRFRETARGQILGLRVGLLKMLVSIEDRRILGVHIVGEGATELIHIGQTAMILGGKLDYFVDNVFNYPTLAENYKVAALDAWNRLVDNGTIE